MGTALHSWEQRGVVRLWRYIEFKRKFGGWHLTADDAGAESLATLVSLLHASPDSYRTVTVTPPSPAVLRVPNFQQGHALWEAPTKWQIRSSTSASTWDFPSYANPAKLTFGANYVSRLVEGLRGIPHGGGDFCIGRTEDDNLALWFWWQPGGV
jgi:hypothetical protein